MRTFLVLAVLMMVAAPASANLLTNGDMSLPPMANPTAVNQPGPISNWIGFGLGDPNGERNKTDWSPGWAGGDIATAPYASKGAGAEPNLLGMYQTVTGLTPGMPLTLTGWMAGKAGGLNSSVYLAILETQYDDPTIPAGAIARKTDGTNQFELLTANYTVPLNGIVVVQWGADCVEGEWEAQFAHADELVLTPEPAGLALFGLGGLLLRRRRRA